MENTYYLIFTSDIYTVARIKQKNLLQNISSLGRGHWSSDPNSQKAKSSKDKKGKENSSFLAPEKKICIGQGGSGMPKSGGYYYGYSTQHCSKQR
ncbi:MAG: hypothetical protein HXM91_08925, partial [Oribacterium sinus]|nr:hypothetical protein [Oribacterium sinus]